MSARNDSRWPFISTDKRPLFFNPQQGAQAVPQWSEPWTYSDAPSRKRRHSEVEEVHAYAQAAAQTANASDSTPQPARKVRITPAYRANRGQQRFRLSDIGGNVNAWAVHRFSGLVTPDPEIGETISEAQRSETARQPGQGRKHVHQESRERTNPTWTAVLQDMNGEVVTFEAERHQWRESQHNHSSGRARVDEDEEMMNVDDGTEHLEEEVLHLRHRYNVLGGNALTRHPGIVIKFFTEEELGRPDLPPPRKTCAYQATVRSEDEEEIYGNRIRQAPSMPGVYLPSPPREMAPSKPASPPGDALSATYGSIVKPGEAQSVVIDSQYGLIHVPAEFGQTATNDITNNWTDSSSESDDCASGDSTISSSEVEDLSPGNNDTNTEHNTSDPTIPLLYPELPASPPTFHTLPAHLIPARVPGSHARPTQTSTDPKPTKNRSGTADAFDHRRALLQESSLKQRPVSKVNTSCGLKTSRLFIGESAAFSRRKLSPHEDNRVTEGHTLSTSTIEKPKAPNLPVIPQITLEPPSNSSRSSSTSSIDQEKLLPPRLSRQRRIIGRSEGGQNPEKSSTSTNVIGGASPSSSAPATGKNDVSKTIQKSQNPSSTNILAGPEILSSAAIKDNGTNPVQNLTELASSDRSAVPARLSFTSSNSSGDATDSAQKTSLESSIPGLGNGINGKEKTASSHSEPTQTGSTSHGKQQGTSHGSSDIKKQRIGLSEWSIAVVCPECTFANPPNAISCEMCEAKFVEDQCSGSSASHLHIPGAFPGSNEEKEDEEMQDVYSPLSPVSDEHIVIYTTSASLNPTNPDHYATGAAGPRGTLGLLGNPLPVSSHEVDRLARERQNTPRGPRGVAYFNERITLDIKEQREYAEIQAWEARRQETLRKLEQEKMNKSPEKEKQKMSQTQEQEKQIELELKAAEEAEAEYGSGFWQMLGFG